jgi:lyso-ornithine lipid O-acyltransferase
MRVGKAHEARGAGMMRAVAVLSAFAAFTLPLMPVQALLLWVSRGHARIFPHWYHRCLCRLLGVGLHVEGEVVKDGPVLLIANHTSWLDIPVLSAVAPLSFVAKKEVGTWPFISALARLQRTIFVDRRRRIAVGAARDEVVERLKAGDAVVLFAEGTSSDGNRVLPFKTSLFAAAKLSRASESSERAACVQTLAVAYTHLHGVPLGRADRTLVGWYGDMEMVSHAWQTLKAGPLDVSIRIGQPVPFASFASRKALARYSETEVRAAVVCMLRGRRPQGWMAAAAPIPGLSAFSASPDLAIEAVEQRRRRKKRFDRRGARSAAPGALT